MRDLSRRQTSFAKLHALSWSKKILLCKVFGTLAVYKGLLMVLPFRFFLREENQSAIVKPAPDEHELAAIVWAIGVVSLRIPLGFTCLVQALSAKWLLKKYPNVRVCIGVQKKVNQGFSAHAWVVYNDKVVLGEQATEAFQPILEWN